MLWWWCTQAVLRHVCMDAPHAALQLVLLSHGLLFTTVIPLL